MSITSVTAQFMHRRMAVSFSSGKTDSWGFREFVDAQSFRWKSQQIYQCPKVLRVNGSIRGCTRINGTKVNGIVVGSSGNKINGQSDVNGFPSEIASRNVRHADSIVELMAMANVALTAEKQGNSIELKDGKSEVLVDTFRLGRLVESNLLYRQTYVIRSYEVGVDKTASIETMMNLLQETALNHVWSVGLAGDGFGATQEMDRRNLIWVVTRMQIKVERYPSWCDVVEVDTWATASGKNGMRRDWLVRDYKSGRILTRATSTWVMMNRVTRRLSKIPEAVKDEIRPYYLDRPAVLPDDTRKLHKLDDGTARYIRSGLTPKWSDLDVNQHVNNVKYIGWILESVPELILENHELLHMTVEYRRECGQSHVLQSLTNLYSDNAGQIKSTSTTSPLYTTGTLDQCESLPVSIQCAHLLRMQPNGSEILRSRTEWRAKGSETPKSSSFV